MSFPLGATRAVLRLEGLKISSGVKTTPMHS
jgi:hypothetical protein